MRKNKKRKVRCVTKTDEKVRDEFLCELFDEKPIFRRVELFFVEEFRFPAKNRFRSESMRKFVDFLSQQICSIYFVNPKFRSLSTVERRNRFLRTIDRFVVLFFSWILSKTIFVEDFCFRESMSNFIGRDLTKFVLDEKIRLDEDSTFVKSVLLLVCLCDSRRSNEENVQVETIWKYLMSKYDERGAVRRFSRLVVRLFDVDQIVDRFQSCKVYRNLIENLVELVESSSFVGRTFSS